MNYDFIETKTIDDYLPAIKDHPEFIVAEREWYNIINYVVSTPETFQDPNEPGITPQERNFRILRKDCRGLKFDKKGDLLAKPYHKFHNVNEKLSTQVDAIDWSLPHIFLEKLDGSMVHPLLVPDHNMFRLSTKMGITETSMFAEEFYAANLPKYGKFIRAMYDQGYTALFEWLSLKSKIVIAYKEDNLVLTGLRHIHTGQYVKYHEMEAIGAKWDIPVVKFHYTSKGIVQFLDSIQDATGVEGWVVRFENGQMVKIKIPEYMIKHNSKEIVSNDRSVYELILNEQIDDVIPMLDADDLAKVRDLEVTLGNMITSLCKIVDNAGEFYKNVDKKEFAINQAKTLDPFMRSAVFMKKDGKASATIVTEHLKKYVGQDKKWETRMNEITGIVDDFF